MPRHIAALTLTLLLAACSSSADLINADQITGFQPGKTNQAEVVVALGKPIHSITEADGTKIDQYPYAEGAKGGGSFIPDWMGGSDTPSSYPMLSFLYAPNGTLKDVDRGGAK